MNKNLEKYYYDIENTYYIRTNFETDRKINIIKSKVISTRNIEYSNNSMKKEIHNYNNSDNKFLYGFSKYATINNNSFKNKKCDDYVDIFYNLSKMDVIEDGIYAESEKFILDIKEKEPNLAIEILSMANIKYFGEYKILISILNIISGFDNKFIKTTPYLKLLTMSCLSNSNDLVKEQALKVFYNCGSKEDVDILEHLEPLKSMWLDNYRKKIINYLKNK